MATAIAVAEPNLSDLMLEIVGQLAKEEQNPPRGVDGDAWRLGYGNAVSDLVRLLWPDAPGGRRLTLSQLRAGDEARRQVRPGMTSDELSEIKARYADLP